MAGMSSAAGQPPGPPSSSTPVAAKAPMENRPSAPMSQGGSQNVDQLALIDGRYAIAQAQHLVQILGDEEDATALIALAQQPVVHGGRGGYVQTAGRMHGHHDPRLERHLAGQQKALQLT